MNAGGNLTASSSNIFIGSQAGSGKTGGNSNILIGTIAGQNNGSGSSNIFIGNGTGSSASATGSGNIFIGNNAGINESGSFLLFIENNSDFSSTPLIGGDFGSSVRRVAINGKPDPSGAMFQINGSLRVGFNGSTIGSIIRSTETITVPTLAGGISTDPLIIDVANALTGSSVIVSPSATLPNGLVIAYARVSETGKVEMKLTNASSGSITGNTYTVYVTVIR